MLDRRPPVAAVVGSLRCGPRLGHDQSGLFATVLAAIVLVPTRAGGGGVERRIHDRPDPLTLQGRPRQAGPPAGPPRSRVAGSSQRPRSRSGMPPLPVV